MHHLGNHFILFDELGVGEKEYARLRTASAVRAICDSQFGLGADGVVFLRKPADNKHSCRMQMFNRDGSEAEMCGNALLALGHLFLQRHRSPAPILVETGGGVREVHATGASEEGLPRYRIDLGQVGFDLESTGELLSAGKRKDLVWRDEALTPTYANVGNPHAVLFSDQGFENDAMLSLGAWLEMHPNHPRRINVEFARVLDPHQVQVHVWERGCGMTNACGTGAAAVAASGIRQGRLKSPVTVNRPGGRLLIELEGASTFLTGAVQEVADGRLSESFVKRICTPDTLSGHHERA